MSKGKSLVWLFILIPLLEIYLLVKAGQFIGVWQTILVVIITALLGSYLLRIQGIQTLQKVQMSMAQGELPTGALMEGLILLVSGILLLTPGFFTDAVGFLGLIPSIRALFIAYLQTRVGLVPNNVQSPSHSPQSTNSVIEGEYHKDE